ncbi:MULTISPECIES: Crp/Fnr family transcriptional regulator [unclassified Aureimonas]|uniref:Crp/Fnr family transcriptional regulator n=1 Tax=unclassified Aureimonas TaxID=2615206 RepID=UPI0006F4DD9C|nr:MULTISPECIES: Crp/Fnr family transcriptional regulator [unclassified Aureimonas]KQT64100.1 hypothetical protein ASG62_03575 [Aureimonas sp. Leaf427]KQT81290.1 hypothetical protein ASG54_00845 [Aureimonas sp. Leaf460]
MTTNSCLVSKLSHYVELTKAESDMLAGLEETTQHHRKRDCIVDRGAPMEDIFVVKSGWLYGHVSSPDGGELVADIFYPGDVVGVGQLAFEEATLTYTAATDVALCPLPKRSLGRIFKEHPRLVALFFAFAALERAAMIDRLRAATLLNARDCVALFLLQVHARLRITRPRIGESFELPLTQEMIGGAVGLSTVSVNRAIRSLELENRIRRNGRILEFLNSAELSKEVDFVDRFYKVDTSWFPGLD